MTPEQIMFLSATIGYFIAFLFYIIVPSGKQSPRWGFFVLAFPGILHLVGMIFRTINSGHAPFANLYESLVFFSWCVVVFTLLMKTSWKNSLFTAFIALIAFLSIAAASILPEAYKEIRPLIPILQSSWLMVHVVTIIIGYAAFSIAFVSSLIFLVRYYRKNISDEATDTLEKWDELTYRMIAIGFPFLTAGILSGAVWANYAWGSYWAWDPKETWSLITWLIYAAYLHTRYVTKRKGVSSHWFSLIGFLAVIFTYFGVNFLTQGLHNLSK